MSKYRVVSALETVNYVHYSWNIYDDSWMAYMVDCIVYPDGPDVSRLAYFYYDYKASKCVRLPDRTVHGDISADDALAFILGKLGIEAEQPKEGGGVWTLNAPSADTR